MFFWCLGLGLGVIESEALGQQQQSVYCFTGGVVSSLQRPWY